MAFPDSMFHNNVVSCGLVGFVIKGDSNLIQANHFWNACGGSEGVEPPGGNPPVISVYMANWGTGRLMDCQFDRDCQLLVENPSSLIVRGNTWHGGHGGIALAAVKRGHVMNNVEITDNMLQCHRPASKFCATITLNESVSEFATSELFPLSHIEGNIYGLMNASVGTRAAASVNLSAPSKVFPDVDLRAQLLAPSVSFAEVSFSVEQPAGQPLVLAPHGWSSPRPGVVRVESGAALPAGSTLRVVASQSGTLPHASMKSDDVSTGSMPARPAPTCEFRREQGRCDGGASTDDTAALNRAMLQCSAQGRPVTIAEGANCTAGPLFLADNTVFRIDGHLQALHRKDWPTEPCGGMAAHRWPPTRGCGDPTDMITVANVNNITITGIGIIHGRGAEWWPGPWYKRGEPDPGILLFVNASRVLVEGVTMMNSPNLHISIGDCNHAGIKSVAADVCGVCEDYTIRHVTIRAPNFELARNTDGIDIAGNRIHIHDVDIANGDDTIQVKSPSKDILVENSTVRTGNGVGIGTAANASIDNVTFRNIVAEDTTFGCHIKFEPPQTGICSNVLFENISIHQTVEAWRRRLPDPDDHAGYAIGIHQSDQGVGDRTAAAKSGAALNGRPVSQVKIANVTYRRIRSQGLFGGSFRCQPGELACSGIRLEDVRLNVSRGGCSFVNTFGENSGEIEPASCRVPQASMKMDDGASGWRRRAVWSPPKLAGK